MNTNILIEALAKDVSPVSQHAAGWRLLFGLLGGSLFTVLLIAIVLGFRSDLAQAMHGPSFWMKWAYTISLGFGAIAMVARLARPEPVSLRAFWPVAIPCALLALAAIAEMAQVPTADWPARQQLSPPQALTEERVREIVRDELNRLGFFSHPNA